MLTYLYIIKYIKPNVASLQSSSCYGHCILTLMTVWSIREKIIRTAIIVSYICTLWIGSSYNLTFRLFLGFVSHKG